MFSVDQREDVRLFAFWLGNGTLLLPTYPEAASYKPFLRENRGALGALFAKFLYEGKQEACRWLHDVGRATTTPTLPIVATMEDWRGAVVAFATKLGERSLCSALLGGIDYLDLFYLEPSVPEMTFNIFCNVLAVDEKNVPVNAEYAEWRAAQYLRQACDESYVIEPPLSDDEVDM